jgi:hypothetical protein
VKVAAAAALLVAVGAVGYGAWLLVEWLIAHLLIVVGVLVALGVLLVKTGRRSGRHCPGCDG